VARPIYAVSDARTLPASTGYEVPLVLQPAPWEQARRTFEEHVDTPPQAAMHDSSMHDSPVTSNGYEVPLLIPVQVQPQPRIGATDVDDANRQPELRPAAAAAVRAALRGRESMLIELDNEEADQFC